MIKKLSQIITVENSNCKNCHVCIAVCPIKLCIDGSGDVVTINHNLCIGCGKCIVACTHKARGIKDDFSAFRVALQKKEKFVALVAPAVATVFDGNYLELNGWLKKIGVDAIFDVSFGAELTVKSYLDYISTAKPKAVIAQPCPAIVTYIEIYKPELLRYLAPADSPMLHTVRMVQHFYPQYKNHRMVMISPCVAKKREFEELELDIFNVTMYSIKKHLAESGIKLDTLKKVDYDNPPAERAVLFSTPGGLLATATREVPNIGSVSRKIEGSDIIYKYLNSLPDAIAEGRNPLLLDCLNCEEGCNGGTGTGFGIEDEEKSLDGIEYYVSRRSAEMKSKYNQNKKGLAFLLGKIKLKKTISSYWKKTFITENIKIDLKPMILKRRLLWKEVKFIKKCSNIRMKI